MGIRVGDLFVVAKIRGSICMGVYNGEPTLMNN